MKLYHDEITTPVRDAASIVLLRDHTDGLQVFLMKRHAASEVMGGVHVFPGGKVDADDVLLEAPLFDQDIQTLAASLNETALSHRQASALYAAAIRETFEESGVLFASPETAERLQTAASLHQGGLPFGQLLMQLNMHLQTRAILPWARWITPKTSNLTQKRYDTRFFIAALPAMQTASCANHESTESVWLGPRQALTLYWNKDISLAPPQIMSLVHLSHHDSVASVMQQAAQTPAPLIEPHHCILDGLHMICFPGDAQHPVNERALPGPTRLYYRNKRFEPIDGFEAMFRNAA